MLVSGAGGAPEQKPKPGGTVVLGTYREPACLNAYLLRCSSNLPVVGILASLPLRGAFRFGPGSTYEPDLASRVEFTTEQPFTLTYSVRREARWSDGRPITARDFVFTHSALRSVRQEMWEPEAEGYANVRSVSAVDPRTVRVVLRSRFAGWRSLFPRVLPAHVLRGQDFSKAWLSEIRDPNTGRPFGSGPFLVERWDRGRSVTFVRNSRYWRGAPQLDRIVVRFCQQCSTFAAEQIAWMRSGELDVVSSVVLTGEEIGELRRTPGVGVRARPGPGWEHLDIRIGTGGHALLKRKGVRRAIAYGIDRVALARTLSGGVDGAYAPRDSAVFPVDSPYYRPNWRFYRHRPGESRRLLEREGCAPGPDGIYACDGGRLALRLATIAGDARRRRELEVIQRQLREIGVDIVPTYFPVGPLFEEIVPSGSFDLVLFSWLAFPDSPGGSADLFGCGGIQNYAGYCQRLVTRDLDQARRILVATRQAQVLNRADAQLARDVPIIPLFQIPFTVATGPAVRDVAIASHFDPFTNAEQWWLDD